MSAFAKIPLQVLILLMGVLVYCFYLFAESPMLFNDVHRQQIEQSSRQDDYNTLEGNFRGAHEKRRAAASALSEARALGDASAVRVATERFVVLDREVESVRRQAVALVREVTGDVAYNDVNYIFPKFVTTHLPVGLVGLLIAAIFAAAMSSAAAELNALSTASVIDFYKRHYRKSASDSHYLRVSKYATGFWGVFASVTALFATNLGSLIEVVNLFGSYFYGSLLGVFVLAVGFRRASASDAFWGLIGGMITVGLVASTTNISYLWYNLVGVVAVCLIGSLRLLRRPR